MKIWFAASSKRQNLGTRFGRAQPRLTFSRHASPSVVVKTRRRESFPRASSFIDRRRNGARPPYRRLPSSLLQLKSYERQRYGLWYGLVKAPPTDEKWTSCCCLCGRVRESRRSHTSAYSQLTCSIVSLVLISLCVHVYRTLRVSLPPPLPSSSFSLSCCS